MAFFKTRKPGDEANMQTPLAQGVDDLRRRARHRLIGAAVLVLAGVIGFPLLFDSAPRPIPVDIPIEIPDKSKVSPLVLAAPPTAPQNGASATAAAVPPPIPVEPAAPVVKEPAREPSIPKQEEKAPIAPVPAASVATKSVVTTEMKAAVKPDANLDPKPEAKPTVKVDAKPAEAAKAQALLDGAADKPAATNTEGRYVVQVGAFADAARAKEARGKVEKAGLKTYTQVVDTKDGQRTRVRVGPFGDKAEADKAAQAIKALSLPAAVLVL
jgi:DedD protein